MTTIGDAIHQFLPPSNEEESTSDPSTVVEIILPTYQTEPKRDEKFYPSQVKKIAGRILHQEIADANIDAKWVEDWYDGADCDEDRDGEEGDDSEGGGGNGVEQLSKRIADKIKYACRNEIKLSPRYKLVVQVTMGQRKDQGVMITSRCLWDTATDQYASSSTSTVSSGGLQNEHVWASVLVFGLYTD